jgi:hypothetical protein
MKKLMGDQDHVKEDLCPYIRGFSPAIRDLFERNKRLNASKVLLQTGFAP